MPNSAGTHEQRGQVGPAAVAVEDDPQRQQRVLGPALRRGRTRPAAAGRAASSDERMVAVVQPSSLAGLGEAVDQGDQPEGRCDGTGDVVLRVAVGPALAHERDRGQRRDDRDRDVDEQAPAPRGVLGEHPAEDQADGRAAAGDRAVDAERRARSLPR